MGLALLMLMGGCASFSDSLKGIEYDLAADRPADALQVLEKQHRFHGDDVLYLLNKAMLLRMTGDYAASNDAFILATRRISDLYGASVSENAAAFIINDSTRIYTAPTFERVLIHLYMALNYLALGQHDQARVEALQVDLTLREQAEHGLKSDKEDALARYLSGKIYEEQGEWSDARIAYVQAYQAYQEHQKKYGMPVPKFVEYDVLRLTQKEGLTQDLADYKKTFALKDAASGPDTADLGQLVFLLNEGLAPLKREHSVTIINPESGRLIRISLPYYENRRSNVARARVTIGGKTVTTELAEDIGAIAKNDLESSMGAIRARALARAVAKDQAARRAAQQNDILGLAVNITNVLTERADTRSWFTLPSHIHLAVITLPPGHYSAKIELLGNNDEVISTRMFDNVVIRAHQIAYLSYHTAA